MTAMQDLLVKLQIYEGPLDLLLHLIKKNEVDLNDVPVAIITAQYLEYLDFMESMNVELAADFLVMAATLTQIKSRLLLSREDGEDEEGDAADDIKSEIIDPLLEHMRFRGFHDFKDAAEALGGRHMLDSDVFVRGWHEIEEEPMNALLPAAGDKLFEASLFDLIEAFRRLAANKTGKNALEFIVANKTIGERIAELQKFLKDNKNCSFAELCSDDRSQGEMTLSLLAALELARTGFLRLYQNLDKSTELFIFLADPDADLSDLSELAY
jgi:segregation and condensation protein A